MVEIYKEQIANSEDLVKIAQILASDPDFQKKVVGQKSSPYDSIPFLKGLQTPPLSFSQKGDTLYLAGYTENGRIGKETEDALALTVEKGLITGIHFISPDGLFLTLLESAITGGLGFDITTDSEVEEKEFLFAKSRYVAVLSVDEDHENALADLFFNKGVKLILLGHVTKGELRIDDMSYGFCKGYLPE